MLHIFWKFFAKKGVESCLAVCLQIPMNLKFNKKLTKEVRLIRPIYLTIEKFNPQIVDACYVPERIIWRNIG